LLQALRDAAHMEAIDLSRCGFGARAVKVIAAWMGDGHHQRLKTLRIGFNGPVANAAAALALGKSVAAHPAMQLLDVRDCGFGKHFVYILRGAGTCVTMRRVLIYDALPAAAQTKLVSFFSHARCLPTLRALVVRAAALSQKVMQQLLPLLLNAKKLRHFDIALNKIKDGTAAAVAELISTHPTLARVHLFGCQLSNKALPLIAAAACRAAPMHTLHLDGHGKAKRLLLLFSNTVNSMEELTLRDAGVTAADINAFFDGAIELKGDQPAPAPTKLLRLRVDANKGISNSDAARLENRLAQLRAANKTKLEVIWRDADVLPIPPVGGIVASPPAPPALS